jgi:hypothetical protein
MLFFQKDTWRSLTKSPISVFNRSSKANKVCRLSSLTLLAWSKHVRQCSSMLSHQRFSLVSRLRWAVCSSNTSYCHHYSINIEDLNGRNWLPYWKESGILISFNRHLKLKESNHTPWQVWSWCTLILTVSLVQLIITSILIMIRISLPRKLSVLESTWDTHL